MLGFSEYREYCYRCTCSNGRLITVNCPLIATLFLYPEYLYAWCIYCGRGEKGYVEVCICLKWILILNRSVFCILGYFTNRFCCINFSKCMVSWYYNYFAVLIADQVPIIYVQALVTFKHMHLPNSPCIVT